MTCAFSNLPKFLDNAGNTGSVRCTGKIGSMLPPGREIDGKLVSRSVLWFSLTGHGVVAVAKHAEAWPICCCNGWDRPHLFLDDGQPGRLFRPLPPVRLRRSAGARNLSRLPHGRGARDGGPLGADHQLSRRDGLPQCAGRKPDGSADQGQDAGAGDGRYRSRMAEDHAPDGRGQDPGSHQGQQGGLANRSGSDRTRSSEDARSART